MLAIGVMALVLLCGLVVMGLLGWLVATGWPLFVTQARSALQQDPVVQTHIGQIRAMELDLLRTGVAPGRDEFVFSLEGDRGAGRVRATWVTAGAEREILTDGVLTLRDGRHYDLPSVPVPTSSEESP